MRLSVLGLVIIYLRRHIPESPRWLLTHGRVDEANRTVDEIEARVRAEGRELSEAPESKAITAVEKPPVPFKQLIGISTTSSWSG